MDNDQIKHMVNRFLMWKLPEHFRPDCGIIYTPIRIADGRLLEPSGTNLLDATQAEAMVRHMIEGLPAARPASGEREGEPRTDAMRRLLTEANARNGELRDALIDATAHLAAATSSYKQFCRKGVTGDALFSTKLSDYEKAEARARAVLKGEP